VIKVISFHTFIIIIDCFFSDRNCKYCEGQSTCVALNKTCPSCKDFDGSDYMCELYLACSWCMSPVEKCYEIDSSCTNVDCPSFTKEQCLQNSECAFCNTSSTCLNAADINIETLCPICHNIENGGICRANPGCSWCYSTQICQNKSESDNCPNCGDYYPENCNSSLIPGCTVCELEKRCNFIGDYCSLCYLLDQSECSKVTQLVQLCSVTVVLFKHSKYLFQLYYI